MSDLEIDPLDPSIDTLLDAERAAAAPKDALDRVWVRVASSTAPLGPPSLVGDRRRSPAVRTAIGTALGFVVGAATGAALHARFAPPARVVVPSAVEAPVVPAPAPPLPSSSAVVTPPPPAKSAPPAAPEDEVSSLAAERAILDDARQSLARGDAPAALRATDRHARRFARPELAEEREAIAVQALVLEQRSDAAHDRAARFRARWPSSLFLPAVEASLASIP